MAEKQPFKILARPKMQDSSMVVAWSEDAGKLGPKVVDYLNEKLQGRVFAEIDPADYFTLDGVSVEDNVAQFPDSKFYSCQGKNLVVFKSNVPRAQWYEFLNSILDVAEHSCKVKELYTIGGMVSSSAHTAPRVLLAIANSPEMKAVLKQHDLASDVDYETPVDQRPTLNSFLLWAAKRRNIAAASLWVPVPFYLVATEDPRAWREAVEFFDRRFGLSIDLGDLDREMARQNEKIAEVRSQYPELDGYINKLESNLSLSADENERLVEQMEKLLRKRHRS